MSDSPQHTPARIGSRGLSLDDFGLVRAIHTGKGLSRAAAELGINHSTAFRRLGQLETALGCKLFERHRTGYQPTPAGEEMIAIADRMEDDAAAFLRKVEGKSLIPSGELKVATNDGLLLSLLTPIFAVFCKLHPQIRLDVVLGNASLNLSRRDADVAIRATERPPETLVGRRIGAIAWAVYGRREDLPANQAIDDLDLFLKRPWIGLGEELASVKAASFLRERIAEDRIVYRVNTVAGALDAVVHGIGLAPLPCAVGDPHPALVRLSTPHQTMADTMWLLTHPDLKQSARVRAFMDFAGQELTRRRPLIEGTAA